VTSKFAKLDNFLYIMHLLFNFYYIYAINPKKLMVY